jgi:hypothetical protein
MRAIMTPLPGNSPLSPARRRELRNAFLRSLPRPTMASNQMRRPTSLARANAVTPLRLNFNAMKKQKVQYRTNSATRARLVNLPSGNRMVAMPNFPKLPEYMKNLNKRKSFDNSNSMLRKYHKDTSRKGLIKFIMYSYYFHFSMKNNSNGPTKEAVRKSLHNFDYMYMNISTRQRGNHSMISPENLWNKLQPLTRTHLLKIAKTLEW